MNQEKIGKFIVECRKRKNLTQMQLAEKLNITDRAISKWERGKGMPDTSIMLDLCKELGISVNELLSGEMIEMNDYDKKTEELLLEIKNKTTTYSKTEDLEYALLISDLNKVIAIEFNKKGEVLSRSSLLLDEEDEVLEEVEYLEIQPIKYKVISTYKTNYTLTRLEQKKKKYLLKEMDTLYQENNISKLTFLYEEIFPKDELSLYDKYLKLKEDIEDNYSNNHNKLYDIVRLTYIKK